MAHVVEDLVEQTSTSRGAAVLVLSGTPRDPFRRFVEVMNDGDTTECMVVNVDRRSEWQAAFYRYEAGVLTFERLIRSATGAAIDFSGGLKRVYMAALASAPMASLVPPGRMVAMREDGQRIVSDPLTSPNVRRIKRVFEHEEQIAIEFTTPSTGEGAFSTGEALHVRLGGWDGATNRLHRAIGYDMMEGDVLRDPYTAAPSATGVNFGGAPKTVDVLDARTIVIRDEPWKVHAEDPAPVFLGAGYVYRKAELVDVRGWIDDVWTWNDDRDHFSLNLGAGFFALKPGDTPELVRRTFRPPAHFTLRGAGRNQTVLFRDDYYNAIPFIYERDDNVSEGIRYFNNRPFQRFAGHGYKATAPDDGPEDGNIHYFAFRRNAVEDTPGYGGNMGHKGGKRDFDIEDNVYNGCTNDGKDIKGAKDSNLEGLAYRGRIKGNRFRNWGLLYYGTNRTRPLLLTKTDPITTVSGSSSVVVWTEQKAYRGQRITFPAGTPDHAGIVFAGRSFKVTSRARPGGTGPWNATIDVSPQVASASGDGGGIGVEIIMPACNKGKPAFDGRGYGLLIEGNICSGHLMRNRIGRLRGKDGSNPNGAGATYSQIIGLTFIDETPPELGYTDGKPLAITAPNVTVEGYKAVLNGTGSGFVASAGATGLQASGIDVIGAATAGALGAPNMNVGVHTKGCTNGFSIDGAGAAISGSLEENPITVTDGSAIVQLAWSADDPDRPSSGSFDLEGAEIQYGVDVNSTWTVLDASDPDFITFDSGQPAQIAEGGTATFGGEGVTYEIEGTVINASGSFRFEMDNMGSGFGVDIGNKTVTDGNLRIAGSYSGTGTAATGLVGRVSWDPGNHGLPKNQRRIDLPTSGTATALTASDGNTRLDLPATASGIVVLPLPPASAAPAGTRYRLLAKPGSVSVGIQLKAQGTDVIRFGSFASSAGGTVTTQSPGAFIEIERAETGQRAWYITNSQGTLAWT